MAGGISAQADEGVALVLTRSRLDQPVLCHCGETEALIELPVGKESTVA